MNIQSLPNVDAQFKNRSGDVFVVIGRGTRGIIIEYISGKVELVSPSRWGHMNTHCSAANF